METVAAREMRLARLLVFSALAARAVADAAAADEDPSRWSLRALTGIGRDDDAPAAENGSSRRWPRPHLVQERFPKIFAAPYRWS